MVWSPYPFKFLEGCISQTWSILEYLDPYKSKALFIKKTFCSSTERNVNRALNDMTECGMSFHKENDNVEKVSFIRNR